MIDNRSHHEGAGSMSRRKTELIQWRHEILDFGDGHKGPGPFRSALDHPVGCMFNQE